MYQRRLARGCTAANSLATKLVAAGAPEPGCTATPCSGWYQRATAQSRRHVSPSAPTTPNVYVAAAARHAAHYEMHDGPQIQVQYVRLTLAGNMVTRA
eukprot:3990620-Prymnesium_polylepis.1